MRGKETYLRMTDSRSPKVVLELFVAGNSLLALRAQDTLEQTLSRAMSRDEFELRVVDIVADPGRAVENRVKASPTLIRRSPLPEVRMIGDFSAASVVLSLLGLSHSKRPEPESGITDTIIDTKES